MNPLLTEFMMALGDMFAFVAPEHRPSVIIRDDYEPYNDPDMPVQALVIGGRFAAFAIVHEHRRGAQEIVRVEEIVPKVKLDQFDDPSLVADCDPHFNAMMVVDKLFHDYYYGNFHRGRKKKNR